MDNESGQDEFENIKDGSKDGFGETELCYHSWENLVNSDERTIICVNCGEDWDINGSDSTIVGVLWQASREAIENLNENVADLRDLLASKLSIVSCSVCSEYIDKDNKENLVLKYGVCCIECLPLVISDASDSSIDSIVDWANANELLTSNIFKKQVLWLKLCALNKYLPRKTSELREELLDLPEGNFKFFSEGSKIKINDLAEKIAMIYGTELPKTEISTVFLAELFDLTVQLYDYADNPNLVERLAQSVKDSLSYPEKELETIIADLLAGSGADSNALGMDLFNMIIETGTEKLLELLKNDNK